MKQTSVPINSLTRTVQIRGVDFPVEGIFNMMAETGGAVVTGDALNDELDSAVHVHLARGKPFPKEILVEAIPTKIFVPYRIRIHAGMQDVKGSRRHRKKYLYFAIPRLY